ncbi:two-component system response regulator YesN [Hydrogenispora ethanolica]|uniref:Two-component system response regulator YesN n=1 Tax=Hydrogenispora ethanolica TaxID=1082276 RepID=A0A4R1SBI1_HYDET|nr:response regulator [Hydrogenispora ethanolica]TCL76769.1 two-component system response regulator YesN [Hydrogenispora ethanolica]
MLKTLLIDDDVFVHTHLKKLIPWEEEGFYLCDAVTNGAEAIRVIEAELPDLIITDMNMPGVDGVMIIQYVQEHYPQIKVIALSAYDDFQYVKESLKRGACDYLLKHTVTAESLLQLLRAVGESIRRERRADAEQRRLAEQLQTGRAVLRQNFIGRLVREGLADPDEARRQIAALHLDLGLRNLVVAAGEIDDYVLLREKFSPGELDNLLKSFADMSAEILQDMGRALISLLEEGRFVVIFSFAELHSTQEMYNAVFTALNRMRSTSKRYLNITACFGLDGVCPGLSEVCGHYRKARRLLGQKFYEGKDRIFYDPAVGAAQPNLPVLEIQDEKRILELIKGYERDPLRQSVAEIFRRIQRYQPNPTSIKLALVSLVNIITKIARDSGIDTALIYGDGQDPYAQLEKFDTLQEMRDWLLAGYEKLIDLLELFCLNPGYDEVTQKAIAYIYRHYREELSLGAIARHTGVNSSYLSRKFKKDSGKGVIEYLHWIRIEKAKLLMAEGRKRVKEIASDVGFQNYNYFFKVFKDSQGMTPLEYEKASRDS